MPRNPTVPFVLRPGLAELRATLTYLCERDFIEVATWTSRKREASARMVEAVFPANGRPFPLLFSFTRDRCLEHHTRDTEVLKDLRTVWDTFPEYSLDNTLIVDDTPDKFRYSQLRALVSIETFAASAGAGAGAGAGADDDGALHALSVDLVARTR